MKKQIKKFKSAQEMLDKIGAYWWWRFIGDEKWEKQHEGYWAIGWKQKYCRSAFLYELGKRVTGKFEFEKPWLQLTLEQRQLLANRWPVDRAFLFSHSMSSQKEPAPMGWASLGFVRVNLKLNNKSLVKSLLRTINERREELGIKPSPNQGRSRTLSWRPIELMDLKALVNGMVLNESEASQVRKAVILYKKSI